VEPQVVLNDGVNHPTPEGRGILFGDLMKNIRRWLDRYQEKLRPMLNDYGYGCTYVQDITCASGICFHKSEKYYSDKGVLFNEDDFNLVSLQIIEFVKDVLENRLEKGNKIQFIILHGGSVTGGFGVFVVKEESEYINKLLNSDNAYLVAMM
jgi:hypothetical protein